MSILIALFSFVLILLCLFTLLVVMVQKPKGDGGMGAALGGGSMEAALGAETGSVLTKITIYAVIGFFVLTFALYLGNLATKKAADDLSGESLLSELAEESTPAESSGDITSESALQQVINLSEESAGDVVSDAVQEGEEAAAGLADEIGAAAKEVKNETEEVTNP